MKILVYIGQNSIVFLCTNHITIRCAKIAMKMAGVTLASCDYVLYWSVLFVIAMIEMVIATQIIANTRLSALIGKKYIQG